MPQPAVALCFGLALLMPLPASSPQDWEEQVTSQIEAIHDEIAPDYEYAADLLIGEIAYAVQVFVTDS